ncbi:MAG TPA: hypothetical protein ENI49_06120 [Thermoplasmatales archaeon]|nr:hypothetical protein [Thermoplasmatales archaeon]
MKQKQVPPHKSLKKQDNDFLERIVNHCYFDALTGQFYCKKCDCVVHVDWPRTYGFCAIHGIL